jgi:hypothetical protein
MVLDSGDYDNSPGCHLLVAVYGHALIIELPQIIKPWMHPASSMYGAAHARKYGVTYADGFLQVFLGPQTNDSLTEKRWSKFLPWTQWRFVRRSFYDLVGAHFWTEPAKHDWVTHREKRESVPKMAFRFNDFDGTEHVASTFITELEWRFGEGWFSWLSYFRKPKIQRSLEIDFSAEIGPEKGSYKGGLRGHGIEMLPGEMHEAAFKRYCDQHHRSKSASFKLQYINKVT